MKHDISKLPKWAQDHIQNLEQELSRKNQDLLQQQLAHSVLTSRRWTTVQGPPDHALSPDLPIYRLFFLSPEGALPAVSLHHKDILLIGRYQEDDTELPHMPQQNQ